MNQNEKNTEKNRHTTPAPKQGDQPRKGTEKERDTNPRKDKNGQNENRPRK